MANPTKANFKASDVTRALRATQRAGLTVGRTEISADGTIRLIHGEGGPAIGTAYDQWKERHHSRSS